jgi:hypothetical protein
LRVLTVLINGKALGGEKFLVVDGLVHTICAQAVLSVKFDIRGENMDGVGAVK